VITIFAVRLFQGDQNAQVHQGQGPTAHYRETTAAERITQFQKGKFINFILLDSLHKFIIIGTNFYLIKSTRIFEIFIIINNKTEGLTNNLYSRNLKMINILLIA
jgi:hypothetical protein